MIYNNSRRILLNDIRESHLKIMFLLIDYLAVRHRSSRLIMFQLIVIISSLHSNLKISMFKNVLLSKNSK